MKNALHVIVPYKFKGMWVFDDDRFGLSREPFVMGADRFVAYLGQAYAKKPEKGFKLIFSAKPIPECHAVATRIGKWSKTGGAYYHAEGSTFWLCPALFHYFKTAPAKIYGRVESLDT